MISLKNISRIYTSKSSEDVVALDNINLTLPEKGFVTIVGASGSGKTTLLNVLGGLDSPTSGHMIVDGISTENFKDKDWDAYRNEKIGFVLQNCYLLPHLSIRDNVLIKLQISNRKYENIEEMADNALKEVGLFERRFDKPKTLSGGQKQRVAIARAVVGQPVMILADEPTGALDSKNGKQIMEILKKLSKEHLVVMVSHNREYADNYSDRIVELADGKIVSDSSPIKEIAVVDGKEMAKVSFPFLTSLKWGFKNLLLKKYSTLSIIIACSLGLTGVGLILSVSKGVESTFVDAESRALSQYPVTISSYSKQSGQGSITEYEEFTDEQVVFADLSSYQTQEHYNYMSDEFLTYMGQMPQDYYYISYDQSYTSFWLFAEVNKDNNVYERVSSTSSLFYKGIDDIDFLDREYDCLTGSFPTNEHEIALVVDTYNRVDGTYLRTLGFDVDTSHYSEIKINFADIIGKTYKYVSNNTYFVYDSENDRYGVTTKSAKELYNSSTYELKISGILREKEDSGNPLFRTGIIYTPAFERMVIENANASDIVIAQKTAGVSKNVLTGAPFEQKQSGTTSLSPEYQLEYALYSYGSFERITTLYYFTKDFDSRKNISNYFEKYVSDEEIDFGTLTYNDYLERAALQFDGAVKMMTSVLYVFAAISVFVSAILNAILTYISIHQRTSEIGLLRSLGARKKDIGIMVETESLICGLLGGFLSVLITVLLVYPVNEMLTRAIYQYNFYVLSRTTFTLPGFQWWVAPIMLGLGLVTALVSALIPAIIASKKDPAHAINE